jgi:hypothetical protein
MRLHLQTNIAALGVLALAGRRWILICVGAGWTAMLLTARGLAIAARTFALMRGGHENSSFPSLPSLL